MPDFSSSSACARSWTLDAPVLNLVVNRRGDALAAALGDGSIAVMASDDRGEDPKIVAAHEGVSLSLAQDADDHAFLSGGDDGRVLLIDPGIAAATEIACEQGRWIDQVAAAPACAAPDGARAYACGKTLVRLDANGAQLGEVLPLPSSAGGLAYSPDGKRLAASHYGGVTLFYAQAQGAQGSLVLPWRGSHLDLLFSPNGRFLLSSLQDSALHGWQLDALQADGGEMHMQGYEAKVRSMGFTAGGAFLATSGAAQIVCWPFGESAAQIGAEQAGVAQAGAGQAGAAQAGAAQAGGPQGKPPLMLGGADAALVTRVAPHPFDPMLAAGFEDGRILFAPLDGRMDIMVHPPIAAQGAAITGLCWNGEGDTLAAASENGWIGLFTLASVSRFVRGRF